MNYSKHLYGFQISVFGHNKYVKYVIFLNIENTVMKILILFICTKLILILSHLNIGIE